MKKHTEIEKLKLRIAALEKELMTLKEHADFKSSCEQRSAQHRISQANQSDSIF